MYIYIYIYIFEKLNKLSFGYYTFISAGYSVRETNSFRYPSGIFAKDSYSFFFFKGVCGGNMGKKSKSKTNVMYSFGVIYSYVTIFLHNS